MFGLAIALLLTSQVDTASVKPTVEELIVYPDGPAWVKLSAQIPGNGSSSVELPRGIDQSTWSIRDGQDRDVTVFWSTMAGDSSWGELRTAKRSYWGEYQLSEANHYTLFSLGSRLHLPADEVIQATTHSPLSVQVVPTEPADKLNVEMTGRVHGVFWEPGYRIILGPDSGKRLSLSALIRNDRPEMIGARKLALSASMNGQPIELGPLELRPFSAVQKHLLQLKADVQMRTVWHVGEPKVPGRNSEPTADLLLGKLDLTLPEGSQAFPAGEAVVLDGTAPITATSIPALSAGKTVSVDLGPTAGWNIERNETEIERKQSAIQRDNEYYDWVRMSGVLSITNQQVESRSITILKTFEGEGTAASDEGTIAHEPNRIGVKEPRTQIRWDLQIAGGETKRLTYGYLLHLHSD